MNELNGPGEIVDDWFVRIPCLFLLYVCMYMYTIYLGSTGTETILLSK